MTADRGTLSASCSSRSRATTLRGLPRTIACDWTHSSRSSLASYVQAVTGVTPAGHGAAGLRDVGVRRVVRRAPARRRCRAPCVFQVTFLTCVDVVEDGCAGLRGVRGRERLAAFGQRRSAAPAEVQVARVVLRVARDRVGRRGARPRRLHHEALRVEHALVDVERGLALALLARARSCRCRSCPRRRARSRA